MSGIVSRGGIRDVVLGFDPVAKCMSSCSKLLSLYSNSFVASALRVNKYGERPNVAKLCRRVAIWLETDHVVPAEGWHRDFELQDASEKG